MITRRVFSFLATLIGLGARSPAYAGPTRLLDDIPKAATWIAAAMRSSGYRTDFSIESMREVERFFREQTRNGKAVRGGLLGENLGSRLFALGCYCGETVRKDVGGEWIADDNDPRGEINIALRLPNGTVCWPVQRVMKRLGDEGENVAVWAAALREG